MPTCNSQILELDTNECVQNYENEFLGQTGRGRVVGFRVEGFRVSGLGFRVWGGGLGIQALSWH